MTSEQPAQRERLPASVWGVVIVLLAVLGIVAASADLARTQKPHPPIVGVYALAKYSAHGDKPTGRIAYDASGRMWVMLLPPDRMPLTRTSAPEEYRDTLRRVVAYYGTYKVDEATGRVFHRVEEASNPAWIGEVFERWYRVDGPNLYISLEPKFEDPLLWKRLPDQPDRYALNK
jgi:hypothetical protein